jgi:hypothetical protein
MRDKAAARTRAMRKVWRKQVTKRLRRGALL